MTLVRFCEIIDCISSNVLAIKYVDSINIITKKKRSAPGMRYAVTIDTSCKRDLHIFANERDI
jgi:hypothetical protein